MLLFRSFCRPAAAVSKFSFQLASSSSTDPRKPPATSHTKMAHATLLNGSQQQSPGRPNSNNKSSTNLGEEIRQKIRRLASLPAKLVLASFVYPVALFWAIIVLKYEVVEFFRAPLEYFKVKSRPYPDVLRPTQQQQHKRAHLPNGITLHYVEQGDVQNPMILFLHGYPEFWYSWRHQLAGLSQNYYCVAVDMRGYGDSSKPVEIKQYTVDKLLSDFSLLLDHLGKQKCTLVAHDWGGVLGWSFAHAHPQKLDRLVVINCPHPQAYYNATNFRQFLKSWYIFFFQLPWLPELVSWRRDVKSLEKLMQEAELNTTEMDAFKYTYQQPQAFKFPINYYRANMKKGLARKFGLSRFIFDDVATPTPTPNRRQQRRVSFAGDRLKKLPASLPTLMIWGVQDKYLIKEQAERAGEYCENYRCVYLEDAGHFVQQQKPNEVNEFIEQFMQNNDVKR